MGYFGSRKNTSIEGIEGSINPSRNGGLTTLKSDICANTSMNYFSPRTRKASVGTGALMKNGLETLQGFNSFSP